MWHKHIITVKKSIREKHFKHVYIHAAHRNQTEHFATKRHKRLLLAMNFCKREMKHSQTHREWLADVYSFAMPTVVPEIM